MFYDYDFPPNNSSLFSKPETEVLDGIEWKRLEEYLDYNVSIFSGGIDPSDIIQGSLGDCWLLAGISCLAEVPTLIENLCQTPIVNHEGKYEFTFNKDGYPHQVVIDSFLPVVSETGKLYSAREHKKHYWVALIEKAFAKLHGGYDLLESGDCEEAMRDLTGLPSSTLEVNPDLNLFWNDLLNHSDKSQYLLTAAIDKRLHNELKDFPGYVLSNGLIMEHVYSILDVREDNSGTRLITLRNPWGKGEYNGKWSDYSSEWTPEKSKFFKLNKNLNDGIFHIEFTDFVRYFNSFSACSTRKDWKISRVVSSFNKNCNEIKVPTIKIDIPDGVGSYLALHQKDHRIKHALDYADIGAVVLKDNKAVAVLDSKLRRSSQKKMDLPPGTYEILPYTSGVHFKNKNDKEREFTFTLHRLGVAETQVELTPYIPCRIEKAFTSACDKLTTPQEKQEFGFQVRFLGAGALMVVGLETTQTIVELNKPLCVLMDLSKSKCIMPTYDSVESLGKYIILHPPELGMQIFKFVRSGTEAFDFSCNFIPIDLPNDHPLMQMAYNTSLMIPFDDQN